MALLVTDINRKIVADKPVDLGFGGDPSLTVEVIEEIRITGDRLRILSSTYITDQALADGKKAVGPPAWTDIPATDEELAGLFAAAKAIVESHRE